MKTLVFQKGSSSLRKGVSGEMEEYYVEHFSHVNGLVVIVHQNICGAKRIYEVHILVESNDSSEICINSQEKQIDGPLDYSQEGLNQLTHDAIGGFLDDLSKFKSKIASLTS